MLEPRPQNGEPEPYRDEDGDGAREGRVRACIREQEAEGEGASEGPREKEEKRLEGPPIRSRTRFQGRFGTHASCIPGGSDETSSGLAAAAVKHVHDSRPLRRDRSLENWPI